MLLSLFVFYFGILQSTSAVKRQQIYNRCPNGSVAHDNSCYKVANALASWTDALVLCEAYGGHLARIDSDSEQQFITGHLKNHLASSTDPAHYYWIGATDAISEGEWYWAKVVEPVKYTNWSPGQPDNDNSHASKHQDCLAIFGQTGKWDDGWCPETHNFICEFEMSYVVVGGTADVGVESLAVSVKDTDLIWKRGIKYCPSLAGAKIESEHVGLRPGRPKSVRLEQEVVSIDGKQQVVVHNYGHGGGGVTLHWGCAEDAAQLVKRALDNRSVKSRL